ncbi:unnamed protein product [Heterobilharzia americana]|nr:unnamed protein product [Heterobilharzia americana]
MKGSRPCRFQRENVRRVETGALCNAFPANYGYKYCDSVVYAAPKPESLPLPPDEWIRVRGTHDLSGVTQHLRHLLRIQIV